MFKIETQKVMQVFVAGAPHAQTRARHHNGGVMTDATPGLRRWKAELKREIKAAQQVLGLPPLEGALAVDLVFLMPTKQRARWGVLCSMKPDKDNLEKAVLDVMGDCGVFKVGDQQVAAGEVIKCWCKADRAGVLIQVKRARVAREQKKAPVPEQNEGEAGITDWLAANP